MASWSNMPQDIGYLIMDKLPEVIEHVRFGVVCKYWYEILRNYQRIHSHSRRALPMLLLPSPSAPAKPEPPVLSALSCLGQYQYQNIQHPLPFSRFRFCGSSNGWLATQNEDFTITLLYPFGSELLSIHLPYLRDESLINHEFLIRKLIVAPESTPADYKIVVIFGEFCTMATIKSGEESWMLLDQLDICLDDIIFFGNMVYGVSGLLVIVMVNIEARPLCSKIVHPKHPTLRYMTTYLVESSLSELYVLGRSYYDVRCEEGDGANLEDEDISDDEDGSDDEHEEDDQDDYDELPPYNIITWTKEFHVYKLKIDKSNGNVLEIVETKDLNGDAFFVGDSESMSFASRCFPGCKSDSIYFTDDLTDIAFYEPNGPEDVGCYNVKDQNIDRFYTMNQCHKKNMPQPIWILPKYHTK